MHSNQPRVIETVAELRAAVASARGAGRRIGMVPTMGALHAGHLSLVQAAQAECGVTVVSIYVNPTQFGPREDFSRYPRTLPQDLELLSACGPTLVFVPADAEMYPHAQATWVTPEGPASPLEGECRPGHFRGVATIVLKLFGMAQPDVAYFGQKDFQQSVVIRRMVADLNVPVEIRVCPTVREPDGLALSSRNRYLSPDGRQRALVLWQALSAARAMVAGGERDAATIRERMRAIILAVPDAQIDYVAVADPDSLQPVKRVNRPAVALLAVRIDGTRLIDNVVLGS